jgi:hypothetical protein
MRQAHEAQGLLNRLLEDPTMRTHANRVMGLPVPETAPDPMQEIRQLRALARERPDLADAADAKIYEIQQRQNQHAVNQAVQENMRAALAPLMLRQQIMTDPQFEPARPFADLVVDLQQRGIPPEIAFHTIGAVLRIAGVGNQNAPAGKAGGNQYIGGPGGVRRKSITEMSDEEFNKASQASWKGQFK